MRQKYPIMFIPGLIVGHKLYEWAQVVDHVRKTAPLFAVHARQRGMLLAERAHHLKETIKAHYEDEKLHLFGHSAGGIDARYMLAKYPEMRRQIVSLTTCGTPHLGTKIADNYFRDFANSELDEMLTGGEKAEKIVKELTTPEMIRLNDEMETRRHLNNQVFCLPIYIGSIFKTGISNWSGYRTLCKDGLANDGTVTVKSQTYGRIIQLIEGDHKCATLPFRYGWPWQTDKYKEVFAALLKRIELLEASNSI